MNSSMPRSEQSAALDASPGAEETHAARLGTNPLETLCGVMSGGTADPPGSREVTCALCLLTWEETWRRPPRYEVPKR